MFTDGAVTASVWKKNRMRVKKWVLEASEEEESGLFEERHVKEKDKDSK